MVDPPGEGFDWTGGESSASLVNALAFAASLLAGNCDGCSGGLLQLVPGGFHRDDAVVGVPEGDIVHCERVGVAGGVGRGLCVFSYAQEIIECHCDQVSSGLGHWPPGEWGWCNAHLFGQVVDQFDRDCQLGFFGGVITNVALDLVI